MELCTHTKYIWRLALGLLSHCKAKRSAYRTLLAVGRECALDGSTLFSYLTSNSTITRKCISCRKCGRPTKWGWKYFFIKPHGLRRRETLNGLNKVKQNRVQRFKWSKQCKHAHHLKKCKWLETNKVTAEWKTGSIAKRIAQSGNVAWTS